ncbi:hypothetical protein [Allorhodopirellula heiligendammensis]|uniref:Uncharacterized protein n=1 Tax=Allorhodopirellula heiligendammensis TaxID=2714739 RepID=A0A5C6C7A7_9BACT|nr:hypothetical protein [Allorhodopirellula heiligendammensis]TWU20012.1 hypothetical protein Poly21_21910 [Allorhodopirellula heiligendammensis]
MNFFQLRGKLTRIAPGLMSLVVGILIGVAWTSDPPAIVTAQSPPPVPSSLPEMFPAADAPFSDPEASASNLTQKSSEFSARQFRDQVGERVTVVEARGGRDVAGSGGLIGFSHVDGEGTQVITIVDAEKRWMAVYHVNSEGTIRLASSREIAADFTLQLNATAPLPDQIRRLQGIPPRSN